MKSEAPIKDGKLICPECGSAMRVKRFRDEFKDVTKERANLILEMQTLLGYSSPEGHNHDDNCLTREYICPSRHMVKIGKQRRCHACNWVGKEACGCHAYEKVREFPDDD